VKCSDLGPEETKTCFLQARTPARNVREIEKADYDAMHTDYSESVDALQRAIAVLKKQSHDLRFAIMGPFCITHCCIPAG
jgi:hypothetical protein